MSDTNLSELASILAHYHISEPWSVLPMESGMNNTTKKIAAGEEFYMLRVYNNHKEDNIVQVEHELLITMHNDKSASIQTPVPVRNKMGQTYGKLADGTLFALYRYIEGDRPVPRYVPHILSLGTAAGKLSKQLAKLELNSEPIYDPYYELSTSYPAVTAEVIEELISLSPDLAARREIIFALMKQFKASAELTAEIKKLPQQWIHGDIVCNNTVARGDEIIAILDFEFVAIDVRAMEPAVIAVDLLNMPNRLSTMHEGIKLMMESFRAEVSLTKEELLAIPSLMKLRLLDVFLHVIVRYRSGLSEIELLCEIIDKTAEHIHFIDSSEALKEIFIVHS